MWNTNNCVSYQQLLVVLLAQLFIISDVNAIIFKNSNILTSAQKQHRQSAIEQLKQIIPPPSKRELGGEEADDEAYARFLSVFGWDPEKAAPKLKKSLEWRKRVKPGTIRPRHCPKLCRQHAWVALTTTTSGLDSSDNDVKYNNFDIPHNCPPFATWRTTRHGLPITYFRCWMWKPDEASSAELEKHVAYHVHHLIRRMRGNVSRMCVIFDMWGFESWMLPYIHRAINVLRMHHPGRAGAMCFINVPGYFTAVWKVISPWLDDEIRSKVFFAPKEVDDLEKVMKYLNKMNLKSGPV